MRQVFLFLCLSFYVAGCSTKPSNVDLAQRVQFVDYEVGLSQHETVLNRFNGEYKNSKVTQYLGTVVDKLSTAAGKPGYSYTVVVLDTPVINAFSLPGGFIYLTRGILSLANSESEIASVIAHEIAHIVSRHAYQRVNRSSSIRQIQDALGNLHSDDKNSANASLDMAQFTQSQELIADAMGIKIAADAGYDPFGAAVLLNSLDRYNRLMSRLTKLDDSEVIDPEDSHPQTEKRIAEALKVAKNTPTNGDTFIGREVYMSAIDGIPYDEDPQAGTVRGQNFYDTSRGITFRADPLFGLTKQKDSIIGLTSGGSAMRFDEVVVPVFQPLLDFITQDWESNVKVLNSNQTTINGLDAAISFAASGEWRFLVVLVRLNKRVYRFITASDEWTSELQRATLDSAATLRQLNSKEKFQIKKWSLRVVQLEEGESFNDLLRYSVRMGYQSELTRILNGLKVNQQPVWGGLYKVVSPY